MKFYKLTEEVKMLILNNIIEIYFNDVKAYEKSNYQSDYNIHMKELLEKKTIIPERIVFLTRKNGFNLGLTPEQNRSVINEFKIFKEEDYKLYMVDIDKLLIVYNKIGNYKDLRNQEDERCVFFDISFDLDEMEA